MDFDPYGNNNVVAIVRKMSFFFFFLGMSLGKTMKEAVVRVPTIPTTIPPFRLGYKPMNEDLLEMELKKTARAKAKAKGFPSSP